MKKITQIIFSILVSIFIAFEVYPASDTKVLVFNTYAIPPLSTKKATGYYDVLIFEAARRANINISIKWMPERRGIIMANQGEQDGHYPRTAEALQSFPNLTIVPTPIYRSTFIAVAKNPIANFSGWESLNKYKVAYPLGWKIFENRKDYYGSAYPIPYPEKLMELVQAGRMDIALYEKTAFDLLANRID